MFEKQAIFATTDEACARALTNAISAAEARVKLLQGVADDDVALCNAKHYAKLPRDVFQSYAKA